MKQNCRHSDIDNPVWIFLIERIALENAISFLRLLPAPSMLNKLRFISVFMVMSKNFFKNSLLFGIGSCL